MNNITKMDKLQRAVLKNIVETSGGDLKIAVPQHQYRQNLRAYGEVDIALAILWLSEHGYIRKASASNLGIVYLTERGQQEDMHSELSSLS